MPVITTIFGVSEVDRNVGKENMFFKHVVSFGSTDKGIGEQQGSWRGQYLKLASLLVK